MTPEQYDQLDHDQAYNEAMKNEEDAWVKKAIEYLEKKAPNLPLCINEFAKDLYHKDDNKDFDPVLVVDEELSYWDD